MQNQQIPTTDKEVEEKIIHLNRHLTNDNIREVYEEAMRELYKIARQKGLPVIDAYAYMLEASIGLPQTFNW